LIACLNFTKEFGLGEGGLKDFPHIKTWACPTKAWKFEKKNAHWTITIQILTSIGQGYMLATPLELTIAMARLASGGKKKSTSRLTQMVPLLSLTWTLIQTISGTILEAAWGVVNAPMAQHSTVVLPLQKWQCL